MVKYRGLLFSFVNFYFVDFFWSDEVESGRQGYTKRKDELIKHVSQNRSEEIVADKDQ